jgi:putative salt-induced outer membrane protein
LPTVSLLLIATPASAELPDPVRAMIEAAYSSGNEATINAVVGVAKQTYPDDIGEINRMAAGDAAILELTRRKQREENDARIAAAGFFEIWKGEVEFGASRSTGNSRTLGIYGATNLTRDALEWRQRLNARIDIQKSNGTTTTERALVAYQPNYKFDERRYLYGIAQYEHDRFLGYTDRFTLGAGMGYGLVNKPRLKIDFEGGPAIRHTDFVEEGRRTTLAARASLVSRWTITPTLSFSQAASVYLEKDNNNASATTSIDTRLIGALKARFSYNVLYERDSLIGQDSVDTLTRATIVYNF